MVIVGFVVKMEVQLLSIKETNIINFVFHINHVMDAEMDWSVCRAA